MRLDLGGIRGRTIETNIRAWPRIIPAAHRATPGGAGFGSSRFSSPTKAFRVLYAAETFETAFAEAVIRDRFVGKSRKYLYHPYLEELLVTEIGSSGQLALLDFTGGAAYELGVDTDAKGARSHERGQEFAQSLYAQTTLDGLIFDSRLTGRKCVAVFDRAFGSLTAAKSVEIMGLSNFWRVKNQRGIIIRRKRGIGPTK